MPVCPKCKPSRNVVISRIIVDGCVGNTVGSLCNLAADLSGCKVSLLNNAHCSHWFFTGGIELVRVLILPWHRVESVPVWVLGASPAWDPVHPRSGVPILCCPVSDVCNRLGRYTSATTQRAHSCPVACMASTVTSPAGS